MKQFKITNTKSFEDNPTDRQERISWWSQEKLKSAKVMVVGAGAIGNETLKNLALLGVGTIYIVDFDTIATSNLSRTVLFRKDDVGKKKAEVAAMRLKEIAFNDDIIIKWFHGDLVWDLGTGAFDDVDIVLGCLDNVEARMAINKNCWLTNTPWIDSGMHELGLRVEFYNPPQEPCYQCNLTPTQFKNSNKRYSCDFAKLKALSEDKMPTTQITSAIVSGIQVQEAVKFLCGQKVTTGSKIYFQGLLNDFDIFEKVPDQYCTAHASYPEVFNLNLNTDHTLKELLNVVSSNEFSGEEAKLDLRGDRTFIESASCKSCNNKIAFMKPTFRINADEFICDSCRSDDLKNNNTVADIESHKVIHEIFGLRITSENILDMTLKQLGIPYKHIIGVFDSNNDYKYYKLNDSFFFKTQ